MDNVLRNSTMGMYINKDFDDIPSQEPDSELQPIMALFNNDFNILEKLSSIFSYDEILGKKNFDNTIEVFFYCLDRKKMIKTIIKEYTFCSFDVNESYKD